MARPATVEARGYTPAPYKQDADETVTCPSCGRMNDTDASYCDQCDHPLTATTAYVRDADETVMCPECSKYNDSDAHFCDQCGIKLEGRPDVVVDEPAQVTDDGSEASDGGLDDMMSGAPVPTSHGFEAGVGPAFSSTVPRTNLVRDFRTKTELRSDAAGNVVQLAGIFARYDQPYEISSFWEGEFIEIVAPGSFTQTIAEDLDAMRCLYDHGFDPMLGNKPIGPIRSLIDTTAGPEYLVDFLNTDYNRNFVIPALEGELISGEKAGSQLGASMRFEVLEDQWNLAPAPATWNPRNLPVRTVLRAKVYEFGPVTFPANPGATAFARSRSDDWLKKVRDDESFFASFSDRVGFRVAQRVRAGVPAGLVAQTEKEASAARWAAQRRRALALVGTSTIATG